MIHTSFAYWDPIDKEVRKISKQRKSSKELGEKSENMNAMDQGANLVSQVFNNMTGVDKGNDGKKSKQ